MLMKAAGRERVGRPAATRLISAMLVGIAIGTACAAAAQPKQANSGGVDPAVAARQFDNKFQNGDGGPAWRALKRDFPDDYNAFLKVYVSTVLSGGNYSRVSAEFIQNHIGMVLDFAPSAPSAELAHLQRAKAAAIEYLSQADIGACAAFASGDQTALQRSLMSNSDRQTLRLFFEIDAASFDAVAAARRAPVPRRKLSADSVAKIRSIAISLGATPDELETIASPTSRDNNQLCKAGVLLFKSIAEAPDDVAAEFAFR